MFWTFGQNNNKGIYLGVDKENNQVSQYVIIEAEDADKANKFAKMIGIYFNNAEDDCKAAHCCGTRWHKVTEGDGTLEPSIYDNLPANYNHIIYYATGLVEKKASND